MSMRTVSYFRGGYCLHSKPRWEERGQAYCYVEALRSWKRDLLKYDCLIKEAKLFLLWP